MNNIHLQIPEENRFINVGLLIEGELNYIDINFIKNPHYWGINIVNPDGEDKVIMKPYNEYELIYNFGYKDKCINLTIMRTDNNYEIIWDDAN